MPQEFHDVPWYLLGALCYSGSLLSLSALLLFKHASLARFRPPSQRRKQTATTGCFSLFIRGELMLVASTIYAVVECVCLIRLPPPT